MSSERKGIALLSDVEKCDAKLFAVALANAAVTIELANRIGLDLDGLEFMVTRGKEEVRFRLVDIPPEPPPDPTKPD